MAVKRQDLCSHAERAATEPRTEAFAGRGRRTAVICPDAWTGHPTGWRSVLGLESATVSSPFMVVRPSLTAVGSGRRGAAPQGRRRAC
jgi:hypothetical protein